MSDTADASPVSIPSYCRLLKNPNVLTAKATSDPTCEFGDKFKGLEAVGNRAAAEKDKGQSLGPSHESKYGQAGSNPPHSAFSQYGCESKCKVWIMLRAHMCSRPTIQTPDPDPFRGNNPDVMIQTEMMNNSIDVRTPCGIVNKQFHMYSGTLSS